MARKHGITRRVFTAVIILGWLALGAAVLVRAAPRLLSPWLKGRVERQLSTSLAKTVTLDALVVDWERGGLRAEVSGVTVTDPAKPGAAPMRVEQVLVDMDVHRSSLQHVVLRRVDVEGVRATFPRREDGAFLGPEDAERAAAMVRHVATDVETLLRGPLPTVEVAWFSVGGVHVDLRDEERDTSLHVRDVELAPVALRPGEMATFNITGHAAGPDAAAPFHVRASVLMPVTLDAAVVPDVDLRVEAQTADIRGVGVFIPPEFPRPSAGRAHVLATVQVRRGAREMAATARVTLDRVALSLHGTTGDTFEATLDLDASMDAVAHQLNVRKLHATGPGFVVDARVFARGLDPVVVETTHADIRGDMTVLRGVLPPAMEVRGVALDGPFTASINARGGSGAVRADLQGMRITAGELVSKRAGVRASFEGTLRLEGAYLHVERARAALVDIRAETSARIHLPTGRVEALQVETGRVKVAQLLAHSPWLARAAGRARAGTVRANAGLVEERLEVSVDAMGLRLDAGGVSARGQVAVHGAVEPGGKDGTMLSMDANLTGMSLAWRPWPREAPLQKPDATPLLLAWAGAWTPARGVKVTRGDVTWGASRAAFTGQLDAPLVQVPMLVVDVSQASVAGGDLRAMHPWLSALPEDPVATFRGSVRVPLRGPGDASLRADTFTLHLPGVDARGHGEVDGVSSGKVRVVLEDASVQPDDLVPLVPARWRPARMPRGYALNAALSTEFPVVEPGRGAVEVQRFHVEGPGLRAEGKGSARDASAPDLAWDITGGKLDVVPFFRAWGVDITAWRGGSPAWLRRVNGKGRVALERVTLPGKAALDGVQLDVALREAVASFTDVSFRFLGGRIRLPSVMLDLRGARPSGRFKGHVEDLELSDVVRGRAGEKAMEGRVAADVDLRFAGADEATLLRSLEGDVALSMETLTLHGVDVMGALRMPGNAPNPLARRDAKRPPVIIKGLAARGRMAGGKVTLEPLEADASFGSLKASGTVDTKGYVDLRGRARIAPRAVKELTGGVFEPAREAETPVRLSGAPGELTISGVQANIFMNDANARELIEAAARLLRERSRDRPR